MQETKCWATFVVAVEAAFGCSWLFLARAFPPSPPFPFLTLETRTNNAGESLSKDAPDCHRKTLRANICVVRRGTNFETSHFHFIPSHPPL